MRKASRGRRAQQTPAPRVSPAMAMAAPVALAALAALIALSTPSASAREDIIPGGRYTSARSASMGDAGLAIADDGASALFNNPANIPRLKSPDLDFVNLQVYGSDAIFTGFGINSYKLYSLQSIQPTLAKTPDTWQGMGAQIAPTFSTRFFALGLLANAQIGAVSLTDGSTRYRSLYQLVPAVGTGARFAGGIVRVGYSLQWVNQASGDITVASGASNLSYTEGLAQGSALSHTLAGAITLPIKFLPSFNLVARNVLGAKYTTTSLVRMAKNSTGAPETEPMSIDASFSMIVKTSQRTAFNLALAYRDATNSSKVSVFGHGAFGGELVLFDKVFVRAGWGTGNPAAGVGIRAKRGEISLGWVAEDIGTTYHERVDRRFMFQYQVRAF